MVGDGLEPGVSMGPMHRARGAKMRSVSSMTANAEARRLVDLGVSTIRRRSNVAISFAQLW